MNLKVFTTILFLLAILISIPQATDAQNVGINDDGSAPDSSAMLDVKSSDKGMLVPRMTTTQREAINNPAKGLLVFDMTQGSFWFFNGTVWKDLSSGSGGTTNEIADSDNDTKIQVEEGPNEDTIRFDMAGTEHFRMAAGRLEVLNSGQSVFIGEGAGANDDHTDNQNTFIGYRAGYANTAGFYNTAYGYNALSVNTTGYYNTAYGTNALHSNTWGLI